MARYCGRPHSVDSLDKKSCGLALRLLLVNKQGLVKVSVSETFLILKCVRGTSGRVQNMHTQGHLACLSVTLFVATLRVEFCSYTAIGSLCLVRAHTA